MNVDVATGPDVTTLCEGLQKATLLDADTDFEEKYNVGNELGKGGWASVFCVQKRDDPEPRSLAVKVMDKANLGHQMGDDVERLAQRMRDECRVLIELSHPRVIQLIEVFESPQYLFIVMEKAEGGALLEKIIEVSPSPVSTDL